MFNKTERNLEEAYNHIKPYLSDKDCTKELREMCKNCEAYYGDEHDYTECRNRMCFKFFLAFEYLNWSNSY